VITAGIFWRGLPVGWRLRLGRFARAFGQPSGDLMQQAIAAFANPLPAAGLAGRDAGLVDAEAGFL
jgi:predicted transcriptional regulator